MVTATIGTLTNGTTNVSLTINAGTYLGVGYCTFCHGAGGGAPPKVPVGNDGACDHLNEGLTAY